MLIPTRWIRAYGTENSREVQEVLKFMLSEHHGREIDVLSIMRYGRENGPEVTGILSNMLMAYRTGRRPA